MIDEAVEAELLKVPADLRVPSRQRVGENRDREVRCPAPRECFGGTGRQHELRGQGSRKCTAEPGDLPGIEVHSTLAKPFREPSLRLLPVGIVGLRSAYVGRVER